jgi:GNAT superfamily N-acetyltransferase
MEPAMPESIITATTADDFRAFARLIREFVDWCRARYDDDKWFVDAAFSHQSLDAELERLPAEYGPPNGRALLAAREGQPCGCVAYRRLEEGVCEMKRLFVPERFQGHGTGRSLCQALIDAAKHDGFEVMRLDTPPVS